MVSLHGPHLFASGWNNLGFIVLLKVEQDSPLQSSLYPQSLSATDVGNLEKASCFLERSAVIESSVSNMYGLGMSDMIQGNYIESTQRFWSIRSHRPGLASLYLGLSLHQRGKKKEALATWKTFSNISLGLQQQARSLLNRGLVDDAISLFKWNTEIEPYSIQAWLDLVEAYKNKNDWQKIQEANNKMLVLDPRNLDVQFLQAQIAFRLYRDVIGAQNMMEVLLPRLRMINSFDDEFRLYLSYIFLSQLARAQDDFDEAIMWQEQAMALPQVGDRWAMAAIADIYQAKGDSRQALAWIDLAIAEAPNDGSMYARQARIFRLQGNLERARRVFVLSLEMSPNVIHTHNDYAALLIDLGDVQSAIEEYHKVLAIDSRNEVAQDGLMRLKSGE